MVGSQEEAAEVRKVGYRANLVKTTKREQNPVVVKMLLRELSKDADLLALRVKLIKEGEDEMTWKDILKAHCGTEKMGCGCADCEKQEMEKLSGNQKKIDADKDGKITGKDFAMLRNKKMKKSESMEEKILQEIEKEGGALGMKNLKQFGEEAEIKRVLAEMNKEGKVFLHENGDIYTHKPVKGMGSKMPGFKGFPKR